MEVLLTKDVKFIILGDPLAIDEGLLNEKALVLKLLSPQVSNHESLEG